MYLNHSVCTVWHICNSFGIDSSTPRNIYLDLFSNRLCKILFSRVRYVTKGCTDCLPMINDVFYSYIFYFLCLVYRDSNDPCYWSSSYPLRGCSLFTLQVFTEDLPWARHCQRCWKNICGQNRRKSTARTSLRRDTVTAALIDKWRSRLLILSISHRFFWAPWRCLQWFLSRLHFCSFWSCLAPPAQFERNMALVDFLHWHSIKNTFLICHMNLDVCPGDV